VSEPPPPPPELPEATSELPHGIVWDSPDGTFREEILTDDPLPCDAASYWAADTTGDILRDAYDGRWLSLVLWSGGRLSAFLHTSSSKVSGVATMTIPWRFDPGRAPRRAKAARDASLT